MVFPKKLRTLKQYLLYRYVMHRYVFAFPKSGMTWAKFFLAEYLSDLCKKDPAFDFGRSVQKYYKNVPRLYFTHMARFPEEEEKLRKFPSLDVEGHINKVISKELKGKHVLLLCRDPRDVVISYYNHLEKEKEMSLSEFIRNPDQGLAVIIQYLNLWILHEEKLGSLEIFRFEDRKKDPEEEFRRLLVALDIEIDEAIFAKALEASSFENMKKKAEAGEMYGAHRDAKAGHRVRKGTSGSYKELLNPEDLAFVNEEMKKLDARFGYSRA